LEPDAYLDSTTSATQLATPTNQLSAIDYANAPDQSFTYDLNGNRTGSGNVIGADNRLTSNATWDFVYDANGNMTRRTLKSDNSYIEYTYDHRDRLTDVRYRTSAGTLTKRVHFGYDALNRRYLQTVENGSGTVLSTVYYVNQGFRKDRGDAGDEIALRLDGAGAVISRYLHGSLVDEVLAEENIGSGGVRDVLWAMTDHQGSVRDLARVTAGTASVVNHIVYDAFGKTVSETDAAIAHLYGFTGRELDKETGLQYNRARYLDLVLARWISQDPKSFAAGDTNLYRYVGNHPSYATDPSGLAEWDPKVIREAIRAADSDFAALFDYHVVTLEPTKESSPIVGYALPSYRYINAYYPENWSNEQVIDAIFANTSTWSDSDLLDYVATASKHFGRYTNPMGYPRNWIGSRGDLVAELQAEQRDKYRKAVAQIAPLITDSMRSFPLFGEGAYATYMIVDGRAIEYATGIVKDSVAAASALGEFARENPKLLIAGGAAVVIVGVDGKILKKFDAPKSTFDLPTIWRSAKGVTGKFSDGKHTFRIDTHNLSPGERFHVHIYNAKGKEIAVIQGRGTNGIWRETHRGQTLLKPSEVSEALRTDIRRLLRNALNNIE
jgi:RHS repeat-associated protein